MCLCLMKRPPSACWTRVLSATDPKQEPATPPTWEILELLPVAWRVGGYIWRETHAGRLPIFDLELPFLQPPTPGPCAGVPLGGLGGGAIGRGWRGEFNRWSLHPGRYVHHAVAADQFFLRIQRGSQSWTQILSVSRPSSLSLPPGMAPPLDPGRVTYHALHPRSWTVFEEPVPGVRVTIRQVSPFLPESYSDASLPTALFHVDVENLSDVPIDSASVMFCFQSGHGEPGSDAGGFVHHAFTMTSEITSDTNASACGVAMSHPKGSFALAADCSDDGDCSVSLFKQFVVSEKPAATSRSSCCSLVFDALEACGIVTAAENKTTSDDSLLDCISLFQATGELLSPFVSAENESDGADSPLKHKPFFNSSLDAPVSKPGQIVGAAVCLKKPVAAAATVSLSFSLSWDHPFVNVGSAVKDKAWLPRYYTRFFGTAGNSAASIASYALLQAQSWEARIVSWQAAALKDLADSLGESGEPAVVPEWYKHQLFNELYYLVDGGTIWTDSSGGSANSASPSSSVSVVGTLQPQVQSTPPQPEMMDRCSSSSESARRGFDADVGDSCMPLVVDSLPPAPVPIALDGLLRQKNNFNSPTPVSATQVINREALESLALTMAAHDVSVQNGPLGDSRIVGQWMYLEGHEYQMYNTYDVHFYAGFALSQLWPHLDFSIQRDVAASVPLADPTVRIMLGTGKSVVRKTAGCVPHDLGSPTEHPLRANAYNFQDVSAWRDLGSKFVLQVYRDSILATRNAASKNQSLSKSNDWVNRFLSDLYPTVKSVLGVMESYDADGDGMIENSGQPDQTYDIWTARGVHAYCGGLYIAALLAASAMALQCGDEASADEFSQRAQRARVAYIARLWNGRYLHYDDSGSAHSDSIMADMLAGQWWTRVCSLPPVLPPQDALSCYRTIYEFNVMKFARNISGGGENPPALFGAVNGMRPNGTVDDSCLQSREVWTGTTYGLAAAMLQESFADLKLAAPASATNLQLRASPGQPFTAMSGATDDEELSPLQPSASEPATTTSELGGPLDTLQRRELRTMAFACAQGVHDAGWQRLGYWFATPEAWVANGNYRSLGYMRPLCIWGMQWGV